MPEDGHVHHLPARIILDRDRKHDAVLEVLLDLLDYRRLPRERDVEDVPPGSRPQADPAPTPYFEAVDHDAGRRRSFQALDLEGVYLLAAPQGLETPDSAVQAHQVLLGKRLAAVQNLPRPRVGGARFLLLLFCEAQDAQREELVYLPPVEEIAGALRRYLGIVVQDDRGRENGMPVSLLPRQHRPRLYVLALFRETFQFLRRVHERDELSALYLQDGMRRDERLPERHLPILAVPRRGVHNLHRELEQTFAHRFGFYLHRPFQRAPAPYERPDCFSAGLRQRLLLDPGGNRDRCAHRRLQVGEPKSRHDDLPLGGFLPGEISLPTDPQLVYEVECVLRVLAADLALHNVQEADLHLDGRSISGHEALGLHEPGVVAALGLAVGARVHAAEGPASLVLLRRAAVGPEYVALVEHGGSDLLDRVRQRSTSFSAASSKHSSGISPSSRAAKYLVPTTSKS